MDFWGFFSAFIAEKDFVDIGGANWYTDSVKKRETTERVGERI